VAFFQKLHTSKALFTRQEDRQEALLGLSAIFMLPFETLPPLLQQYAQVVLIDALSFMRKYRHQEYLSARDEAMEIVKEQAKLRGVPWKTLASAELLAPDPYSDENWKSDSEETTETDDVELEEEEEDADEDDDGEGDEDYDIEDEDDDELGDEGMKKLAEEEAELDFGEYVEFSEIEEENLLSPFLRIDCEIVFGTAMKKLVASASTNPAVATMLSSLAPKYQKQIQHWMTECDKSQQQQQ